MTEISCNYNDIKSLQGVEHFTALITLYCRNNQLTELDLSANTTLENLTCDNNQLTALDLSANSALRVLQCEDNQLGGLDLSANMALKILHCENNQLTTLYISSSKLCVLNCENNQLTSLDISDCPDLVDAYLNGERTENAGCVSYILNYKKMYVDTTVTIIAS